MLDRVRSNGYIGLMRKPKRPRDPNQLGKLIAELATKQTVEIMPPSSANIHAVELGRLGGLKGGKARAKRLSRDQRIKIAKKAARARWKKLKP